MIRHVVLWKLKPEAADSEVLAQNLAQIYRNCQRMVEEMPLIRRFSFYSGIKQGKDLYEAATAMDFDSLEALAEFQASPAHHDPDSRAFCELVRERKAVIDFEIQENQ